MIQHELGVRGGAVDLNAACSGFVYGLVAADGFLRAGMQRVLLIGSETMSRIVDWDDRGTAILFGDGAGAVVLERGDGPGRLLGFDLGSDGSQRHILHAEVGGTIEMDGPEVFRRAVRVMVASATTALANAGVEVDDLALFVPHQANARRIASACAKLGLTPERTGNIVYFKAGSDRECTTVAASVDGVPKVEAMPDPPPTGSETASCVVILGT